MVNQDDCITEVVGYQKPGVPIYTLDGSIFVDGKVVGDGVDVDNILLPRIVQNDPAISGFRVDDDVDDLESIGRAIGSSHCLRRLELFWDNDEDDELLHNAEQQSFLVRLADNRSIEHLELDIHIDLDIEALAPFLEHNANLRCISCLFGTIAPSLISVMSQLKMNRLARIDFSHSEFSDETAAELCNALNEMPGLQNLLDLHLAGNRIARKGCVALCALLKNSDCRIISIDLSCNAMDDACAGILISGLIACSSLISLRFGTGRGQDDFTSIGWKSFSTYLSSPRCSLQKLVLSFNIGDASAPNIEVSQV